MARCHRLKSDPDLGYKFNPRTMRMRTAGDRGVRNQLDEDLVDTSLDLAWAPPAGTAWVEDRGVRREYDADARSWTASPIRLLVASEPFAQGGLRLRAPRARARRENAADGARAATVDVARRPWAERGVVSAPELTYELVGADDDDDDAAATAPPRGANDVVIKQWIEPGAAPERTFGEVAAQAVAAQCARRFNDACAARGLATRVSFARRACSSSTAIPSRSRASRASRARSSSTPTTSATSAGCPRWARASACRVAAASKPARACATSRSRSVISRLADSGGSLVVCDIQGVGLCFTDPQIHTADGRGFGLGNLGQSGIDRFLKGYRHGPMARRLGLHTRKRASRRRRRPASSCSLALSRRSDAKKPMTSIRVCLEEESDGPAAQGAPAPLSEVTIGMIAA